MKLWKTILAGAMALAAIVFFATRANFFSIHGPESHEGAMMGASADLDPLAGAGGLESGSPESNDASPLDAPFSAAILLVLETCPMLAGIFPAGGGNDFPVTPLMLGEEVIISAGAVSLSLVKQVPPIICTEKVFQGRVARGDTISAILANSTSERVGHYVDAMGKVFSHKSLKEGQPYSVTTDPDSGKLSRFEYEINDQRKLVIEGAEAPKARVEEIEYDTRLTATAGTISDNLFQTVADIGEQPQLALQLVKLFGSEINFIRHLRSGDSFSVLVEKRFRNGAYSGYGRILAATFTNRGKTYEAFLFHDADGKAQYYNAKGENLHKAFLQSPLAFTRITSRFTQHRRHPILGATRPHLGTDYGAPTGTPVKAVGDGVVVKRGWGGGFGNQIILRHSSGLESMYGHLSGFARGLKEGGKVSQGQVIGFVGSTGLSTGPHLDFRLRRGDVYINPDKAINPRGAPVGKITEFRRVMEIERACLNGERDIATYAVDSIVPLVVKSKKESVQAPKAAKVSKKTRKKVNSARKPSRKRR